MKQKAILFFNGLEIRRVNDYSLIDTEMRKKDMPNGYEWKFIVETEKPIIVPTLEKIVKEEVPTETPHPEHPDFKEVLINYTAQRKSDNEIIQAIENLKQVANQSLINSGGQTEELQYLTMYALIRLAKGKSVPPQANILVLAVEDIAQGILANGLNAENLINQINLGGDPDINTGWTNG